MPSITLVNGTKHQWVNIYQSSYQMDRWEFPKVIEPGTSVKVDYGRSWNPFRNQNDDGGEVHYLLNGTNNSFQIQATTVGGFHIQVALTDIATAGNPQGSVINLGCCDVNFILSGRVGNFTSSNGPVSWMQNNLSLLGPRTLRGICIPGSHDSGMSIFGASTAFAQECNTITQQHGILQQLLSGARYFDIRPVITGGQYSTGHYTDVGGLISWQGANGQNIASIISEINQFTAEHKELVILHLSHDLNTDVGQRNYRPFNQVEWNNLIFQLTGLNNLYIAPNPNVELTHLRLNDFIGGNKAAVVVVIEPDNPEVNLRIYANQGFYTAKTNPRDNTRYNFTVFNMFTDTDNLTNMSNDQIEKMKRLKTSVAGSYFLLSWVLSQSDFGAFACPIFADSILGLSNQANPELYARILNECTSQSFPNILYLDNVTYDLDLNLKSIGALAMAVNWKIAP